MTGIMSRREALTRIAALGLTVPVVPALITHNAAAQRTATPGSTPKGLVHKGINYDVGTAFYPGYATRPESHRAFLRQEIEAVRDQLHCTSVGIFGGEVDRLVEGATVAAEAGLHVWLQPRFIDTGADEMLSQLADMATAAEALTSYGPEIVVDVGCELTLFGDGIIPGNSFAERINNLLSSLDQLPVFNQQLNDLLQQAVKKTRAHFSGPVTYGSGTWEDVDWRDLDYVGVDE
jgi:hypothetical protein